ncbi:MAG: hypothetical protein GTO45_02325 [Candidatus Aminicenantes bacterium]|nr:hypothetical protein [Candidatus Aminicenantes bacterium]NIM77559.1 hypothetical protein [Candidatus Aminicenantes bacterium]NIN16881.1 hypothetical protein [Candidatus Aminicenantes bacterium]NIN40769.1 hypothetical protein [Candidatus Aminicenantes bacterium]NIN83578.1 hypothetical protein [Candidatus Aminicenantes bacterium]
MQTISVRLQIERKLDALPLEQQRRVLDFITHLDYPGFPPGIPGKDLIQFAGTLSPEDAEELIQIIEDGCEKIDYNKTK